MNVAPPAGLMAKGRDRGGEDQWDSRLRRGERRIVFVGKSSVQENPMRVAAAPSAYILDKILKARSANIKGRREYVVDC
jgi:hypothetical protein